MAKWWRSTPFRSPSGITSRRRADPGAELVDIVDASDSVVAVVTRAEVRRRNLWHRCVFIVVTSADGRVLVHRRSDDKDVWPGRWDLAVGGVVATGESFAAAAQRELAEEIGVVDARPTAIGAGRYEDDDVRVVARVYGLTADGPFTFADGEVVEARFVSRAELDQMLQRESFVPDSVALALPLLGPPM